MKLNEDMIPAGELQLKKLQEKDIASYLIHSSALHLHLINTRKVTTRVHMILKS